VTPFEYMQAMAEMWGRAGKDFAAAQQDMFSDMAGQMAKAAGQPGASAVLPNAVDYQELTQANASFAKLWSSAAELSATLTRNMQTGETQDRMVTELLGKIFDPRGWFSSMEGMDQALQRMAEGPRLADVWDTERRMLTLFNAWAALRRRNLEHNTVVLQAWLQAAGGFARQLNEKAEKQEALGSWREVLSLWVETANTAMLEAQRSEPYLKSQRETLKAATDLRLAQQDMAGFYSEMFGYPTRQEIDDVHRTVTQLRRELRVLQRATRQATNPKPAKRAKKSPAAAAKQARSR
jgi:poly[(R)-3-hydroxyalkanoate] polymerase subunit PhaE